MRDREIDMSKPFVFLATMAFACGDETPSPKSNSSQLTAQTVESDVKRARSDSSMASLTASAAQFLGALPIGGPDCKAHQASLRAALRDLEHLTPHVSEYVSLHQQRQQKLTALTVLKAQSLQPVLLLHELAAATHDNVKLVSLSETNGHIKLHGLSANNPDLSAFLQSLEKSALFQVLFKFDQFGRAGWCQAEEFFYFYENVTTGGPIVGTSRLDNGKSQIGDVIGRRSGQ